jgi:ParB-like chromosome segregation protein Spo0J
MAAPKIALRKIDELTPDPRNARTHSADQVEQLAGSIARFGWTNPVLADDLIRAGHGRVMAARHIYENGGTIYTAPGKERGGKAIPKGTVPVIDCTGWTEDERKAYALADNQLALQAGWDTELLAAQLDELTAVDFDIEAIGFDQAALDALAGGDPEGGPEGTPRDTTGELEDSTFSHEDQFAVIVRCKDAAEQEARFTRLRDEFGPDEVKVVVV